MLTFYITEKNTITKPWYTFLAILFFSIVISVREAKYAPESLFKFCYKGSPIHSDHSVSALLLIGTWGHENEGLQNIWQRNDTQVTILYFTSPWPSALTTLSTIILSMSSLLNFTTPSKYCEQWWRAWVTLISWWFYVFFSAERLIT